MVKQVCVGYFNRRIGGYRKEEEGEKVIELYLDGYLLVSQVVLQQTSQKERL